MSSLALKPTPGPAVGRPPVISGRRLLAAYLDPLPLPLSLLSSCVSEPSTIVGIPFGGGSVAYALVDPALVVEVLTTRRGQFRREARFMETFSPLLGTGLITDESDEWQPRRRRVQAALRANRRLLEALTVSAAEALVDAWTPGEIRDLHDELSTLHWRILVASVLGPGENGSQPDTGVTGNRLEGVTGNRLEDPGRASPHDAGVFSPRWTALRARLPLAPLDGCGADRSSDASDGGIRNLLGKDGEPDPNAPEFRDQLITLLFGGRDTTISALTWTFVALAAQPSVQDRLRDELRSELGSDRPTAELVGRLPYLRAVISEALRLYPPTAFLTRAPIEEVELGGFHLPAGATLLLSPWLTQRDPRNFQEPLAFNPDRWRDAPRGPGTGYFPFGAGPRTCVARADALVELSLVVALVIGRNRVTLDAAEPLPTPSPTLVPATPALARLEPAAG